MSYFRRKDGRWCVKFPAGTIADDPERTLIYCGRGLEGEAKATRINRELGLDKQARRAGPVFFEICNEYMRSRASSMAETTIYSTFKSLEAHIYPFFGSRKVYDITPGMLDQYVAERRKPQVKETEKADGTIERKIIYIKSVTIGRELSIVKAALSWAVSRNFIAVNPVAGYKLPKKDNFIQPPPTSAELALILHHAAPHLRRAIILSFYVGLRPGREELLSLKWSSVDLPCRTIFVESAKKGGIESRTIPINAILFKHISSWHKEDKKRKSMPATVVHYKGREIASIKTAWRLAKASAGITRRLKLYSIRHATTTALMSAGNDPKTVSGITGNTVEVMLGVYYRSSSDQKVAALESMPDITDTIDTNDTKKKGISRKRKPRKS